MLIQPKIQPRIQKSKINKKVQKNLHMTGTNKASYIHSPIHSIYVYRQNMLNCCGRGHTISSPDIEQINIIHYGERHNLRRRYSFSTRFTDMLLQERSVLVIEAKTYYK